MNGTLFEKEHIEKVVLISNYEGGAMRTLITLTILSSLAILACSTTRGTHVNKNRYSRDHIYSEEINVAMGATAYELIRNLRTHWLQGRGTNSLSYPVVFVNDIREGNLYVLSTITTAHIAEIQFFNSADAFIRFGPDCPAGAILVTTN